MRNAVRWAKEEWAIIANGSQMSTTDKVRWLLQWGPFAANTALFGTISMTAGPLSRDFAASAWAQRRWSQASLRTLGVEVTVSGEEHVPAAGAFVYMSNHVSLLDILVLGATLPRDPKWVAKRAVMRVPFLGWHLAMAGHVPVERGGSKTTASSALNRFTAVLARGKPLLLFPEGTRSPDGELRGFKSGGFRAAVHAEAPIVPVVIEGTHSMMSKHASHMHDHSTQKVHVRIGAPLQAPNVEQVEDRVAHLCSETRTVMLRMQQGLRAELSREPAVAQGDAAVAEARSRAS